MRKFIFHLFLLAVIVSFLSCGGGDDNPVPVLSSLTPSYSVSKLPGFTLHAVGSKFVQGAKIIFNGSQKQTTYVSSTELTCNISSADIAALAEDMGDDLLQQANLGDSTVNVTVENPTPGGGNSDSLQFTILSNHSFIASKNLQPSDKDSVSPRIALDTGGNVNVVWTEYLNDPDNTEIYMLRSTDGGTNWGQKITVSDTSDISLNPDIAIDSSNNICVVWQEWVSSSTQYDIYLRRSTTSGTNWGPSINISNSKWESSNPSIAIGSNGTIYLVWLERTYISGVDKYDINTSRSIDNGITWSQPVVITDVYCESAPKISISNLGTLAVVWRDGGCSNKGEIYFSLSTDQGAQWSTPVNISNSIYAESTLPDVIFDYSANIFVAWKDDVSANAEIFFSKSSNNGATWTSPLNISNDAGFSRSPSLKVDLAGNINAVWMDQTPGNFEVYYSRSTDTGNTWSTPVNASNTSLDSQNPKLALNTAGYIFIVWIDKTPGNPDIFFGRSRLPGVD